MIEPTGGGASTSKVASINPSARRCSPGDTQAAKTKRRRRMGRGNMVMRSCNEKPRAVFSLRMPMRNPTHGLSAHFLNDLLQLRRHFRDGQAPDRHRAIRLLAHGNVDFAERRVL